MKRVMPSKAAGKRPGSALADPETAERCLAIPATMCTPMGIAFAKLDDLAQRHYRLTAEELLASLDTELGRRQYARLLGVLMKESFSEEYKRPPSEYTKSVIGLRWKTGEHIRSEAVGTWQFELTRALESEGKRRPLTDDQTQIEFTRYQRESKFGHALLSAFRKRLCQDRSSNELKAIQAAIVEAKKHGVNLTDPTRAQLSVGLTSVVIVAIAPYLPIAVAAVGSPVIGMIVLLLIQVGLDGFCEWSAVAASESQTLEKKEDPDHPATKKVGAKRKNTKEK